MTKKNKRSEEPVVVEARKRNRERRAEENRTQIKAFVDTQIAIEDGDFR